MERIDVIGGTGRRRTLRPETAPRFGRRYSILQALEVQRELRWHRQGKAAELKLYWSARAIQHMLQILPGETILELGAGSGLFSAQLSTLLQEENPLTTIVFSQDLLARAVHRQLPGVTPLSADRLSTLPDAQFDYVIGSGMLLHPDFSECLTWIHRLLKTGGRMLFFEPNFRVPARLFNEFRAQPLQLTNRYSKSSQVVQACSDAGFEEITLTTYDILPTQLGVRWLSKLQTTAVLFEHMPVVRSACARVCILARKPGVRDKNQPNLAHHAALYRAVSVVLPAHNEAGNLPRLVHRLRSLYDSYIHEILVVNDNSTDDTAAVAASLAETDSRVRLINRSKPNGVGLALKDGYRAATGKYILSMDCDFVEIVPQMRDLFRAVAEGRDGAIGSRFSHESILVNYPFGKLLFNRCCHLIIKMFLVSTVRDITNNLKLYRSEILKELKISSPHFSANLETGLKPLLAGYDIVEVPISWFGRTSEMGFSTFYLRSVGFAYARTLLACWRQNRRRARGLIQIAWRQLLTRSAEPCKTRDQL